MTTKALFLAGIVSLTTSLCVADEIDLHCRELQGTHEASIQTGAALTAQDVQSLPEALKAEVLDSEAASYFNMTLFRGEAVPQTVVAVGLMNDVKLDVKSLDGSIHLSTYLDEIGPNDISSSLYLDGQALEMNCQ